jgi:hypothetical protein
MRRNSKLFLLCLILGSALSSADWSPIPPAVWAMKEDPSKGIKGAVILERRLIFRNVQIEHLLRIRILSDYGRKAAELSEFDEDAHSFEGRTVYPDGKEIPFSEKKDFTRGTAISMGNEEIKRTVMIPPGVTSDCVVEISWKESANQRARSPLPKRLGQAGEWVLGDAYPALLTVVEIPNSFPWAYVLQPGAARQPEVKENGGFRTFTFNDLPAFEEEPYSIQGTRSTPRLSVFYQPDQLLPYARKQSPDYWDAAAKIFVRNWFDGDVQTGSRFRAFAKDLTGQLVGTDQMRAKAILTSLEARIVNRGYLTQDEKSQLKAAKDYPEDEDLDAVVKGGTASPYGMRLLLFQLLKSAGIPMKIGLVADRDQRIAKKNSFNLFQFTNYLIGVDEPGQKTLWLDPARRFLSAGLIHPDYQGTAAWVVDGATWKGAFQTLEPQPSSANTRTYQYRVELDEGEERFAVTATFGGYPSYAERYRFMLLEPGEQTRLLREEMENRFKQATFSRTEIINAKDPTKPFSWAVEGRAEREDGRRMEVYPFPGMYSPLRQPDSWPPGRKDLIVLPYLRVHKAVSRIKVPSGYGLPVIEPLEVRNPFGSVSWNVKAIEPTHEVEVTLEVVVNGFASQPNGYAEFRTFMSWVDDASRRTVILGRQP